VPVLFVKRLHRDFLSARASALDRATGSWR
jgi:hypothetical protein